MATPAQLLDNARCLDCVLPPGSRIAVMLYLLALRAGMPTDPNVLLDQSKCFACIPPGAQAQVMLYLLAAQAGQTDPAVILDASRCFECIPPGLQGAAMITLLDTLATNCPQDLLVAWSPASIPLGQVFGFGALTPSAPNNAITSLVFKAPTVNDGGYRVTTFPSLLTISWPNLVTATASLLGIVVNSNAVLVSVSAPLLTTLSGTFSVASNPSLTSISFPSLVTVGGSSGAAFNTNVSLTSIVLTSLVTVTGFFTVAGSVALTTLNLPALVTAGASATGFTANGCTLLANVSFPNWSPPNTRNVNFGNCALTQASVDHILARCVANAGYVSGTVTLNGGTSSAPSAAGLADAATLTGRGVTVLHN